MSTVQLRGGLETKSQDSTGTNGKKKERKSADARATLEKIRKGMPHAEINLKPRGTEAVLDDGRLKAADLIKYVDDYAKEVFRFVVDVARPFMRSAEKDAEELGVELWDDLCQDGAQTIRSRYEDYAGTISAVRNFEAGSDGMLDEQAAFQGRGEFIAKLCGRVKQMAELAVLYDLLLYAPDKLEMDRLMESGDAEANRVFLCLGRGAEKAPIYAFGLGWKVKDEAFGQYHDLAAEKLKKAVITRSRQLATAHSEAVAAEQRRMEATEDCIPVEALLFGSPAEVNGKTAVIRWEHEGRGNAIVVRRQDKALLVESVSGAAEKNFRDLQEINKACGLKNVLAMVFNIVDDKTGMLVAKKSDGKYIFHIRTPEVVDDEDAKAWWNATLYLTLWIRTGCQSCVSPARIPEPVAAASKTAAPAARQPDRQAEAQKPLSVDDGDESTGTFRR